MIVAADLTGEAGQKKLKPKVRVGRCFWTTGQWTLGNAGSVEGKAKAAQTALLFSFTDQVMQYIICVTINLPVLACVLLPRCHKRTSRVDETHTHRGMHDSRGKKRCRLLRLLPIRLDLIRGVAAAGAGQGRQTGAETDEEKMTQAFGWIFDVSFSSCWCC